MTVDPIAYKREWRWRTGRHQPMEQYRAEHTARCGTRAGINRHRNQGEPVCAACKAADAAYQRQRRQRAAGDA